MEKYSAFRDPGTGIQPFLTPIPASGNDFAQKLLLPFTLVIATAKTLLVVALGILYVLIVYVICLPLAAVPSLHRRVRYLFTAILTRVALLATGLWWIPVEVINRKRVRGQPDKTWNPQAGDIIVSNWVSWIEILWLAFRFDPVFVLPICEPVQFPEPDSRSSTPITNTPGRRTGTGSAAISSPVIRTATARSKILGFRPVSMLTMLRATGSVPPFFPSATVPVSLEEIRRSSDRPVVVFPECTTSNGRGLLRFADVFEHEKNIPVKGYDIFVMCVRYDPPTALVPSLSLSIPSASLNPLGHLYTLTSAIAPLTLSIRLLALSESPSSGAFMLSDVLTNGGRGQDLLSETCATLIAQVGKMKQTGMGWEDKASFLDFYKGKHK